MTDNDNQNIIHEFISGCCIGEKCKICGKDATNKLSEVIFYDDPNPIRHELTVYVCKDHFKVIMYGCGLLSNDEINNIE